MTGEEAIKIIDCYDIGFYDLSGAKIPADKLADAFDMAIEALHREEAEEKGYCHRIKPKEYFSADAEPIVIRSKTLLPTKDFKEWAKRIKEVNPNAVVIPCDAEVASADAEQGEWIPCSERLPEDGERVLATHLGGVNPNRQVIEHIYQCGEFTCGWDMDMNVGSPTFSQRYMGKVIAWMPLPKPYKGGDDGMTREEAIEVLNGILILNYKEWWDDKCDEAIEMAIESLSADADVVRCKDCKHYIVEGITTQYGWCHEYKHSVNEDDYCSYGERKEP